MTERDPIAIPFPYELTPPSGPPPPYGSRGSISRGRAIAVRNYFRLQEIRKYVLQKTAETGLPGQVNGPADAFRHTLLAGILVAEFGKDDALAILDAIEDRSGGRATSDPDLARQTALDHAVNVAAIEAMANVTNRAEAEATAARVIRDAIAQGGTGANGTIPYLPREDWKAFTAGPYPQLEPEWRQIPDAWSNGARDEAGRGNAAIVVDAILARPPESWSEADARKVMGDPRYWKRQEPRIAALVERSFQHRYPGTTGGPVDVDAYTRGDGTQVAAHTRAAPRSGPA